MTGPKSKASPQHSPLPWRVDESFPGNFTLGYIDGGVPLDTIWKENAWTNNAEAKANAKLIVQAVNSHKVAREMAKWIMAMSTADTFDAASRYAAKELAHKFQEMNRE